MEIASKPVTKKTLANGKRICREWFAVDTNVVE
jgi:hypothetical protein